MSRRRGKACIGVEAGIDVNFEDRWLCLRDRRGSRRGHSRQARTGPSRTWRASPGSRQAPARPSPARSGAACRHRPRCRSSIWRRSRRCAGAPHRQSSNTISAIGSTLARPRSSSSERLNSRPSMIAFRKMLGAEARDAVGDDAGSVGALYHRALVEPERAMLPHRLDDDACIRIEAVRRPPRSRASAGLHCSSFSLVATFDSVSSQASEWAPV